MTEKTEFENNQVLLWGENQASKKLLDIYDIGNKNPMSASRKIKADEVKPKKIKIRVFNEEEKYTKKDIPFLKKEMKRITDEQLTADDDKLDDLLELQDKIDEAIENAENEEEDMEGEGIDSDSDNDKSKSSIIGTGYKKGSPEAIAWALRMKEAKEAKQGKPTPKAAPKAAVKSSKARFEKGSEEAKKAAQKMVEARKKKMEAKKAEEAKKQEKIELISKKKGKPWFYIGDIPKGYREATQDEAIEGKKVSTYGKYKVDMDRWILYRDFNILLAYTKKPREVQWIMNGIEKRIMKCLKDIQITEGKMDSGKLTKEKGENKLEDLKYLKKKLISGFNWYLKFIAQLYDKPYVKREFKLIEEEQAPIKLTKSNYNPKVEVIIDPRTGKAPEELKVRYITFIKGNDKIELKETWFDNDGLLLSDKAEKLYKKNILLDKSLYDPDDYKKFTYIRA